MYRRTDFTPAVYFRENTTLTCYGAMQLSRDFARQHDESITAGANALLNSLKVDKHIHVCTVLLSARRIFPRQDAVDAEKHI